MELNYIISIVDRKKIEDVYVLYERAGVQMEHSLLCHGSTKTQYIDKNGIEATDKGIVYGVGCSSATKKYFEEAIDKLMIDIPGNGLIATVPIKSVKGGRTMAYLTNNSVKEIKKTNVPKFNNELIIVILNEGYTDAVMTAAKKAGATGGTVLHAKGTGAKNAEQFFGASLANEREIIYIVAESKIKADIMNTIDKECGVLTEVGAICFSLPVTNVVGLRKKK